MNILTLNDLISRVNSYAGASASLFTDSDKQDFINEAIDRTRKISELRNMVHLTLSSQEPILLPKQYHHLLSVYAVSRCYTQDEQSSLAQMFMNEFEVKLDELENGIKNGSIIIYDENNFIVVSDDSIDNVKDVYFNS